MTWIINIILSTFIFALSILLIIIISISSSYQIFNYTTLINSFTWYITQFKAFHNLLIILIYQENIRIFCLNLIFYDIMNFIIWFSTDFSNSFIISIEYIISYQWMIIWIYINSKFLNKKTSSKLLFISMNILLS